MLIKGVSYDRKPEAVEVFPYGSKKKCRVDFPVNITKEDSIFTADVYSIEIPYFSNILEVITRDFYTWFEKAKRIGDDVLK